MAKQTFTTGQVLTASEMTSLQATAMGGGAATAKTASYVLVAADAGTTVAMNAAGATTITVNTGLFAAGDTVFIQNLGAGVCTITAGTATVDTAGALALPQYDAGILYFTSASAAIFYDYIQVGAASPLTTKGDLYGFSTLDARIPIGANNTVLTADSSESLGLKWAAASASAFNGAQVKKSSAQSINAGTVTTITFDQENYDTNTYHDNSTNNSRLTVPTTGYYRFTINTGMANYPVGVNEFVQIRLLKNGTQVQASLTQYIASFDAQATASDYFEFAYYNDLAQSLNGTFSVQFLGA